MSGQVTLRAGSRRISDTDCDIRHLTVIFATTVPHSTA